MSFCLRVFVFIFTRKRILVNTKAERQKDTKVTKILNDKKCNILLKMSNIIPREEYERVGKIILDCAFEVHKELGAGLFESVYEECLLIELRNRGLNAENQVHLPVYYKGEKLNKYFMIDMLVEKIIALELKSANSLYAIDEFQLVSYMKLANIKLGYLLNFNEVLLKDGIRRKYNNYYFSNDERNEQNK